MKFNALGHSVLCVVMSVIVGAVKFALFDKSTGPTCEAVRGEGLVVSGMNCKCCQ